ncbi:hypothetical protein B0O80DRAFT_430036 [Mortierella sp. GBAus27b]|nr:hypothetical protein B0O80DRAFT_430036 [Mortierella sp. GBAus27b]
MDVDKFAEYFDVTPDINIPEWHLPVKLHYASLHEADHLAVVITVVIQIHTLQGPGQGEIGHAASSWDIKKRDSRTCHLSNQSIASIRTTLSLRVLSQLIEPGQRMADFPGDLTLAEMLTTAENHHCAENLGLLWR